jgi:hypothetical protein
MGRRLLASPLASPSARRLGHGKAMAESQLIANHAIMLMFIPFIPSSNLRDEYSRATGK